MLERHLRAPARGGPGRAVRRRAHTAPRSSARVWARSSWRMPIRSGCCRSSERARVPAGAAAERRRGRRRAPRARPVAGDARRGDAVRLTARRASWSPSPCSAGRSAAARRPSSPDDCATMRTGIRLTGADPCGRRGGGAMLLLLLAPPAQAELVGEFNARLKDVKRSYGAYTVVDGRARLRHDRRPDAAAGRGHRALPARGGAAAPVPARSASSAIPRRSSCGPTRCSAAPGHFASGPDRARRATAHPGAVLGRRAPVPRPGPRRCARHRGRARDPERAHAGICVPGAGGTPLQQLRGGPAVRLPARAADPRQAADPGARPAPGRDPPHDRRPGDAPPRARPAVLDEGARVPLLPEGVLRGRLRLRGQRNRSRAAAA